MEKSREDLGFSLQVSLAGQGPSVPTTKSGGRRPEDFARNSTV